MLLAPANTALLLFTRTPREEARRKQLLGAGKKRAQEQLFQKLGQHARSLGQQTKLPFFVIDSEAQRGETFGERFYQALAAVFARGFAKVIAIGNDCAQLRAADITQAANLLQNQNAVFGPAQDGGVYLLGIDYTLFSRSAEFRQINWQTATVLRELRGWAGAEHATLASVYTDLDAAPDLHLAYRKNLLPRVILHFLTLFFSAGQRFGRRYLSCVSTYLTHPLSRRGPPALA